MELNRYNQKDRAQTAHVRLRIRKNIGLDPPLVVGHQKWYDASRENFAGNRAIRDVSRHHVAKGRLTGHLPITRDMITTETNKNIHGYNQDVNLVVYELDVIYDALNPAVLNRLQAKLELALTNVRKDITTNAQSIRVRAKRPERESKFIGRGDDALLTEARQLREIKKTLDVAHMHLVSLLRRVNTCRRKGTQVIRERKSAIQLAPQAYPRDFRLGRSRTSIPSSRAEKEKRALSAKIDTAHIDASKCSATSPVTPAVKSFVGEGKALIQETKETIARLEDLIAEQTVLAQTIHLKVNSTISRRLAETENLISQAELADAHQKQAIRSVDRYRDHVMKSKCMTLGPESSTQLMVSESLSRPLVKNYSRHYGNKTNEVHLLSRAGRGLDGQRKSAEMELGKLTRGRTKLVDEIRDKKMASSIDADILRIRRRKVAVV